MDWTGRLTLKIFFMLSNETHSPIGLHDTSYYPQYSLLAQTDLANKIFWMTIANNLPWASFPNNCQHRGKQKLRIKDLREQQHHMLLNFISQEAF